LLRSDGGTDDGNIGDGDTNDGDTAGWLPPARSGASPRRIVGLDDFEALDTPAEGAVLAGTGVFLAGRVVAGVLRWGGTGGLRSESQI